MLAVMRQDAQGRPLYPQVCTSAAFADQLKLHCDWFSAVPDSVIKRVLPLLTPYQFAPRENHAVGAAFGAAIAGKRPCVLLQNSGLGLALDALLGLFRLYGQGLLLVVSNRGELAWEEVQHQDWGVITPPLLKATGFPVFDFEEGGLPSIDSAARAAFEEGEIAVVLLHRGNLDE
jgi:sulfopyruvate decarboxylase TPP-binding subunit